MWNIVHFPIFAIWAMKKTQLLIDYSGLFTHLAFVWAYDNTVFIIFPNRNKTYPPRINHGPPGLDVFPNRNPHL